ncbi:PAS domain S-box protein [Synechococcus sp. H70.2]|uniref:sensor histidine kinase n=4 Tax=unclassified Synechococcus TaxID=2626047 RepID=UPI0039C18F52
MTIPGGLLETVSLVVRDTLRNWPWLLLWAASLLALVFWQRRRLHQAQVGFPDIVTLARPDTTLVECNEVCQRVLGDWRGRRWVEALLPEEQEQVRQQIAQLTPQQPTFTRVDRMVDAAGQVRWLEWINQGIFDRRGRLQFIRGVGRDITKQKQLEDNLRLREAQLQALLDALPAAIWARDPQGVLILQNATDRAWFGDLLGTSLQEGARQYPQWLEFTCQALADLERQGIFQMEGKEIIQGQERYVYRLAVKLQDESKGLGYLGITLDITEQKRLEQRVQEQQERFCAFLNNSHDILCWIDAQGLVYPLNRPVAEKILGRCPKERELIPLDWVHPEDQEIIASALEQLKARPGETLSFIYRAQHADGHWVWLESRCTNLLQDPAVAGIVCSTRDITQQKETELALRESEARLKAILDGIPFPIFVKDLQGRYLQVNQAYLQKNGKLPEEVLGKADTEFFSPEEALEFRKGDQRAIQSPAPISYECTICRDGKKQETWITKFALRDWQGDPYAICGIAVDITPLKEAQDLLRQEAERERLLGSLLRRIREKLDLQPLLQTTAAEVREFLQVDRVMIYQLQEGMGGFVAAESVLDPWPSHLGRSVWDACFRQDPCYRKYQQGFVQAIDNVATAPLDPCYRELLDSFQAQANLVIPIRRGEELWGLLVAQHCRASRSWQEREIRLLQELAEQLAIALQQAQLYEQVKALNQTLEEKVQQRTAELERALQFEAILKRITDRVRDSLDEAEILSDAVRELGESLDADGCDIGLYNADLTLSTISYEYCPRSASHLNVSLPLVGGPYDDIHRQLLRGQLCLFCFSGTAPENRQVVMACPLLDKGQVLGDLWISRSAARPFDNQEIQLIQQVANQCAIGLRQARLFQAAQEQVQALERLNRLKDDFISTVSHELRTPLASLKMALKMLQMAPSPEKRAQYLSIAERECQREIELINDLLDLQRLQAGAYALEVQALTWQELLGDLLTVTEERAHAKGQSFHASVPLESSLTTDPLLLSRILRELLHNAVKYTPAQGSIHLQIETENRQSRIQVSNSQEIPAEELTRIFERFYRIPSKDPWKEGGTGLGLALVKQMVDQLRGSIEVSSAAGWTTFTLHLPHLPQL